MQYKNTSAINIPIFKVKISESDFMILKMNVSVILVYIIEIKIIVIGRFPLLPFTFNTFNIIKIISKNI